MKKKSILWSLGIALLLSGCVTSSRPTKPILNVKMIGTEMTTPLSIHFFTLKSDNVFKKLDYFELVSSRRINWNNELISRAKTLLLPGKTEIFQVQLTSDIQYYALVIGFKDVEDNDNWRYIQSVNSNENTNIALKLSQENGYHSRVVTQSEDIKKTATNKKSKSTIINRVGGKVSNRVKSKANRAVDSTIDHTVDRVFGHIF